MKVICVVFVFASAALHHEDFSESKIISDKSKIGESNMHEEPWLVSSAKLTSAREVESVDLQAYYTNFFGVAEANAAASDEWYEGHCTHGETWPTYAPIPEAALARKLTRLGEHIQGRLHEHQGLLDEKDKLYFCAIPKNGCTEMRQLLLRVLGWNKALWNPVQAGFQQWCVHFAPLPVLKKLHEKSILQSFFDPELHRAVMLRDPVQRFVSAFDSKLKDCEVADTFGKIKGLCKGPSPNTYGVALDVLEKMLRNGEAVDHHFRPQSQLCSLQETWPCFDLIGNIAENPQGLAESWLSLGGVDPGLAQHGFGSNGTMALFPDHGREAHARSMAVSDHVPLDPATEKRIRRLYSEDYEMLAKVQSTSPKERKAMCAKLMSKAFKTDT